MSSMVDIGTLIVRTPGIAGGRPHLEGTSVSVRRIVVWYKLGYNPEEIAQQLGLTLAQMYAALAYYHANREAIEEDLAAEEAEANHLEQEYLKRKGRERQ